MFYKQLLYYNVLKLKTRKKTVQVQYRIDHLFDTSKLLAGSPDMESTALARAITISCACHQGKENPSQARSNVYLYDRASKQTDEQMPSP